MKIIILKKLKQSVFVLIGFILFTSLINKNLNVYQAFNLKMFERSLVLIPTGSLFNENEYLLKGVSDTTTIYSFFISKYEVSNKQYLEFINEIEKTDSVLYKKILPDTLVWRSKLSFNEPYVNYYLRHPAYANYPVVGITHEQAELYCEWITKKYMNECKRKYVKAVFKLPTLKQWIYSAQGGNNSYIFPWNGNYF